MTPNLFLATQRVFSPHKWFRSSKGERLTSKIEFWPDGPVPGRYEYIPGRGWYLIATLADPSIDLTPFKETSKTSTTSTNATTPDLSTLPFTTLPTPIQAHYSRVLKRYFLDPDYRARKTTSTITTERGTARTVGFFQLDDGVAWVQCWDETGAFVPGPYQLWCIDAQTNRFRHMRRGDDPNHASRSNSVVDPSSTTASSMKSSAAAAAVETPRNRRSQDSRSTEFRIATAAAPAPGSPRTALPTHSASSTRPNSIRLTSNYTSTPSSSQAVSRRSSPGRNNSVALEEAKAALRRMAREQEANEAAKAMGKGEVLERGRKAERG